MVGKEREEDFMICRWREWWEMLEDRRWVACSCIYMEQWVRIHDAWFNEQTVL